MVRENINSLFGFFILLSVIVVIILFIVFPTGHTIKITVCLNIKLLRNVYVFYNSAK